MAITNQYFIPAALLDVWSSRQKFDVVVEAFTAWMLVASNQSSLQAPTKPPTQPTNLRIFATQQVIYHSLFKRI
jgi:hypothetical protein